MASPNNKRAVSYMPATELHIVPKKEFYREEDSQRQSAELNDTRATAKEIRDRIPPAIIPAQSKFTYNDQIKKTIPPARMIYPAQTALASRRTLLNAAELHQLYAGTSVPAHRYLSSLLSMAVTSPAIALDPAKWLDGISGVDLSKVVEAWLHTNGNTEYEQLNSIELDAITGWLSGVIKVKQRCGYCGGPSTSGSREFVSIWVDWGSGFQYEGTTSVAVHDFSNLPAAGLEYKVFLPVDILADVQPSSKGVRRVKVRAVLSWNNPPSTTDPYAPVIWGNSLDGLILIPLGINVSSGARSSTKDAPAGSCLRAIS